MNGGERLREVRLQQGLSQEEFGLLFDKKLFQIGDIERGKVKVSPDFALEIQKKFNISRNWLLFGEGSASLTEKTPRDEATHTIRVPRLAVTAAAGTGNSLEAIDEFAVLDEVVMDARLFRTAPPKDIRSICIDGYSMIPILLPGTWVCFDSDSRFRGDGLYILNWQNELMAKLLQVDPKGNMHIISANKDYKSWVMAPDDQSVFGIMGKILKIVI